MYISYRLSSQPIVFPSYIYTVFRFFVNNGIINNVFFISKITEKYTKKYDTNEDMQDQDSYAIKSK